MGGGLMQLVAYGAQDVYLTGNPQITFFKVVYRRYTNFAIEAIEQTVNGTAQLGKKFSVTIARNGDLLSRVYLEIEWTPPDDSNMDGFGPKGCFCKAEGETPPFNTTGFQLIDYVEVEVGGQCIDKQYGEWMSIWCDLTHTTAQKSMLNRMFLGSTFCAGSPTSQRTYLPLQFWFCRNPGLALPLIALQYHEVKLNVQMSSCHAACNSNCICNLCVYADYVFLDTDERRRFAQVSHEYLIEQVQYSNDITLSGDCSSSTELRFNHPVKELMWVISTCGCNQDACAAASSGSGACVGNNCGCFADDGGCGGLRQPGDDGDLPKGTVNPDFMTAETCLIQLNGHDRFRKRSGDYFTTVQRYEHHTGGFVRRVHTVPSVVHLYSFALKPEEHQPSGTCNFSRIDNAVLVQTFPSTKAGNDFAGLCQKPSSLRVYAVNYNVLRIMSGMGGLAYSN
jgi:hypothetical protein